MAYCIKCGEPIHDGVKFCSNCGTATSSVTGDNVQSRKQEWAGNIVQCPACGELIPSFTAICPSCGFEVNAQKGATIVKQFIEDINELDVIIAKDPEPPKEEWSTWRKEYRILWVLLNILTVGIPLVIYLVFPMMKPFLFPDKIPELSVNEKRKAALIENSTFPNEREAIVEAMMFVKSKMAFLVAEKFDRKNLYWADIWSTKAEQLKHRANFILKDDQIVETAYADIKVNTGKLKKKRNAYAGIGFIVIGVYLILVSVSVYVRFNPEKKIEMIKQSNTNSTTVIQDEKQDDTIETPDDTNANQPSNNQAGESNKISIPNDFTAGYEKAEFAQYNALESENGLGGSRIYFYCTLDETEILEADGTTSILGYVTDDSGNEWLIQLHFVPAVSRTFFDSCVGKELVLRGVYSGFSKVKELPVVVLDEMIVLDTGENIVGMQKLLDE